MKLSNWFWLVCSAVTACGGTHVEPAQAPDERPAEVATAASAGGETGQAPKKTPSEPGAAEGAPQAPKTEQPKKAEQDAEKQDESCPEGMELVEGDYCTYGDGRSDQTAVEHECLKEWYAPQNKKRICEEFVEGKSKCLGKKVHKRYCIDRYEYPNKKGVRPEVMNKFNQAQIKCAAQGKRMCTESEWTFACEGPDMKPFPYGYKRDATKCNGDAEWDAPKMEKVAQRDEAELSRLWQGVPSGQAQCVSDFGVYDLPGNTDEVAAAETDKGKFDSITTGGPWYKGVRNQCRPKIYTHDEGFYYYYLSFRCCAEPDGKPSEPLTPRQQKEGWTMKKVEGIAGITVEEMKAVLEKKAKDATCGCKESDKRCRTMCGTLLGPQTKDRTR